MPETQTQLERPKELEGYYGLHMGFESKGSPRELLWDKDLLNAFLIKAIQVVQMNLIMGPFIAEYFGPIQGDEGITGIAVLAESHIACHFYPERAGFMTLDIYSCNHFEEDKLVELICETFRPTEIVEIKLTKRGLNC